MLDRAFWTTNSKKDWNDFWYNSEDIYPKQTKHNYNELVDYQVQTMKNPPFNSEAYRNYKEQTNNKRSPSAYTTGRERMSSGISNASKFPMNQRMDGKRSSGNSSSHRGPQ